MRLSAPVPVSISPCLPVVCQDAGPPPASGAKQDNERCNGSCSARLGGRGIGQERQTTRAPAPRTWETGAFFCEVDRDRNAANPFAAYRETCYNANNLNENGPNSWQGRGAVSWTGTRGRRLSMADYSRFVSHCQAITSCNTRYSGCALRAASSIQPGRPGANPCAGRFLFLSLGKVRG